ncbi:DMT family transporter, partial [bacterium]|nr:DMT family transporter [bacterium]
VTIPHLGEVLSVLAALIWAISVVLFRMSGREFKPLALNFFKNMVAAVLLLATLLVAGQSLFRDAPLLDYVLLALSGILGVAIADTLFFKSLNIVGAGLSQIVSLSYSPFVILFTFVFLGERLTIGDLAGATLILVGVLLTTARGSTSSDVSAHDLRVGIVLATLSVALMALAVMLAKPVLDRSPVLWSTTVRLLAGVIALMLLTVVSPRRRYLWSTLRPSRSWKIAIPAAVLGAYVAMIVWVAGMKYTQASTASILNQTSAVFVLPLAAIFLHERVTLRKLASVAMAVAGVALVTLT